MKQYRDELLAAKVNVWVRRAGPNYQEGLKNMRATVDELGIPCHLYGPETHITAVVPLALGIRDANDYPEFDADIDSRGMAASMPRSVSEGGLERMASESTPPPPLSRVPSVVCDEHAVSDMTKETKSIVYGLQTVAVQVLILRH
jgi:ATP citrate (pro-S)-lyase